MVSPKSSRSLTRSRHRRALMRRLGIKLYFDGGGTPGSFTVVYSLDIVAVRIEEERRVVPWVIRPFARGSIVSSPMFHANLMERVHHQAISGLERKMVAPGQGSLGRRRCLR